MDKKGVFLLIALIVIALAIGQQKIKFPNRFLFSAISNDPYSIPLKTESAYSPKDLIENKDNFRKSSFTKQPLFSVVQSNNPLFTFFNPDIAGYCCDNACNYQCSGSFEYCDAWCNPPTEKSCPSGYVLVNNNQNCCPSTTPYYKAGFCFSEPKVDYPTSNGCPYSACMQPIASTGSGGYVLYNLVGFPAGGVDCGKSFGTSPSGIWFQDPVSGCCATFRTVGEYKYGGGGGSELINPLGILCSDRLVEGDEPICPNCQKGVLPCTQDGATATCHVKASDKCPQNISSTNSIQCIDNIRYRSCIQVGGILQGIQINQHYKLSSVISACAVGQLCENNQCVGDADRDGISDTKDKCPNTPLAQKVDENGCIPTCKANEVTLVDGTCKQLVQTCIDNNLNNICDLDDPIVWADPLNNVPICADRNGDRVCDGVESLFCKDSNNNKLCDSDEIKWLATYCLDANGNGICDGIENTKTICDKTIEPVCDLDTNITYPNQCFANAYNVVNKISGSCKVAPVIIRKDCATGDVPIPSGYICDFETGWLFRRDVIYQNITIDCRGKQLEGYTCTQVGEEWIWTRTEFVNIDCYSRGCPKSNQLCQGGICIESLKRCPNEIDCKAVFGKDSSCDEEIGLCTKIQFKFINKTIEQPSKQTYFSTIPTWVKVAGGIIIGLFLLRWLL